MILYPGYKQHCFSVQTLSLISLRKSSRIRSIKFIKCLWYKLQLTNFSMFLQRKEKWVKHSIYSMEYQRSCVKHKSTPRVLCPSIKFYKHWWELVRFEEAGTSSRKRFMNLQLRSIALHSVLWRRVLLNKAMHRT